MSNSVYRQQQATLGQILQAVQLSLLGLPVLLFLESRSKSSKMALERLQQVKNALTSTIEPHGNQIVSSALNPFRVRVPAHLPPYETPLTPVSFLLRAAQIYPDSTAMDHPERGYKFTYSEVRCHQIPLCRMLTFGSRTVGMAHCEFSTWLARKRCQARG